MKSWTFTGSGAPAEPAVGQHQHRADAVLLQALAAADTDSPGAMHIGVGDMMSRIFLTMLHLLY